VRLGDRLKLGDDLLAGRDVTMDEDYNKPSSTPTQHRHKKGPGR
jgi:hypothetical protein